MRPELIDCKAQALQLPLAERAALAECLIASLDTMDDVQNEQLWLDEADRRYREYKKGNVSARCADEVLRNARSAIR